MSRAEKIIAFIEKYCRVPEGALVGKPIRLAPFQKKFIFDVYDNQRATTRKGILSIARKNGKTALIACLLLAHLVGPEAKRNSQIASGAMSREQAALVFKLASKMVQLNPSLEAITRIIPSTKMLIGLPMNVEYRALAAEGKTAHGASLVLAILDEVGQVKGPQDDFVDAVITSQGAYEDPLLLVISTQAPTDADLLSIWIDDALSSEDPRVVCHLYAADDGADLADEEGWAAANPALDLFRQRKDLESQADRAIRMPAAENTFRNLCLNQRVSTTTPFVSRSVWLENAGDPHPPSTPVRVGIDLSARTDLTAMVVVGKGETGVDVWSFFWTPEKGLQERCKRDRAPYDVWVREGYLRTTPGATVEYGYVAREIAEILSDFEVESIAYDRWRFDILRHEFDTMGLADLPMTPFGQGYKDMSPALDLLEADLLNGRIRHGGHPVLTMCAANAVVSTDPAGNRKLDKHKATGRIDGMIALAMAEGVYQDVEPVPTPELIIL